MARAVLKGLCMKMRNSTAKKSGARQVSARPSRGELINLPRVYLFLELFVDIPGRSSK